MARSGFVAVATLLLMVVLVPPAGAQSKCTKAVEDGDGVCSMEAMAAETAEEDEAIWTKCMREELSAAGLKEGEDFTLVKEANGYSKVACTVP